MGKKGVCKRLSQSCENPDLEHLIIDSTIVRAHQHAAGAKKGEVKIRRSGVRAAASNRYDIAATSRCHRLMGKCDVHCKTFASWGRRAAQSWLEDHGNSGRADLNPARG